jgi:hypothetical protein
MISSPRKCFPGLLEIFGDAPKICRSRGLFSLRPGLSAGLLYLKIIRFLRPRLTH